MSATTRNIALMVLACASIAIICADAVGAVAAGSDATAVLGGWSRRALVIFEVREVHTSQDRPTEIVRPLGTLSGAFDSGAVQSLETELDLTAPKICQVSLTVMNCDNALHQFERRALALMRLTQFRTTIEPWFPDTILTQDEFSGGIDLTSNNSFEKNLAPIREFWDKNVEQKPVQPSPNPADGYWATHDLIYATVRGTEQAPGSKPSFSIDLNPLVTLSGKFDCGLTPRLSLNVDAKLVPKERRSAVAGANVLVLLAEKEKSIAIATDFSDFMPGGHSPFCIVKSFGDSRVSATSRAVQELRAKEYARALAATPLAGKKGTIHFTGKKWTEDLEFLSETKAVFKAPLSDSGYPGLKPKDTELTVSRQGASFTLSMGAYRSVFEGIVSGDQIAGTVDLMSGRPNVAFSGTLH